MIVMKELLYYFLFLIKNGPLKGNASNLPSFCINNYLISLLLRPYTRMFLLGVEVRSSLIFGMIWIGFGDLCSYGHVGASLDHYGDERHCQSYGELVSMWLGLNFFMS